MEESINISNKELLILSQFQNNKIYQKNFENVEINENNQIVVLKYENYLVNLCPTLETKAIIYNKTLHMICQVTDVKLYAEFQKKEGINLIWKNSIQNEEATFKYKQIINSFDQEEKINENIEILKFELENLYSIRHEEKLKNIISRIIFEESTGIQLSGSIVTKDEYETLQDFLKALFYYYLVGYLKQPISFDKITNKLFIEVFLQLISTNIFNNNLFIDMITKFMWETEKNNLNSINAFQKNILNPSFYLDIINSQGISKETWKTLNNDWNNLYLFSLLNFSGYFYNIINSINIDKREKIIKVQLISTNEIKEQNIDFWFQKPIFINRDDKIIIKKSNLGEMHIIFWMLSFILLFYLTISLATLIFFIFYIRKVFQIK